MDMCMSHEMQVAIDQLSHTLEIKAGQAAWILRNADYAMGRWRHEHYVSRCPVYYEILVHLAGWFGPLSEVMPRGRDFYSSSKARVATSFEGKITFLPTSVFSRTFTPHKIFDTHDVHHRDIEWHMSDLWGDPDHLVLVPQGSTRHKLMRP